ncbi:MAG: N-acetyltransferase [Faecousia sp.]
MMNYTVRNATLADLPRIEEIYANARDFMAKTGNPNQWGKTNPPHDVLVDDIEKQLLHVITHEQEIHGVFYFFIGADPTYGQIEDGAWCSDAPYGTIHRIASDGSGGILRTAVEYCSQFIGNIRIDTHQDNLVMQKCVDRLGFRRSGIIHLANGSPRIAYELFV